MLLESANGDWAAFRLSIDFDSSAGVASAAFLMFAVGMTTGRLGGDWVQVRVGSVTLQRLALAIAGVGSVLATLVPVEACVDRRVPDRGPRYLGAVPAALRPGCPHARPGRFRLRRAR